MALGAERLLLLLSWNSTTGCAIIQWRKIWQYQSKSYGILLIQWIRFLKFGLTIHNVFNLSLRFGKISTHDLRSTIENSTLFQPPAEKSSTRNIRQYQVSLGQVIIVGANVHPLETMFTVTWTLNNLSSKLLILKTHQILVVAFFCLLQIPIMWLDLKSISLLVLSTNSCHYHLDLLCSLFNVYTPFWSHVSKDCNL